MKQNLVFEQFLLGLKLMTFILSVKHPEGKLYPGRRCMSSLLWWPGRKEKEAGEDLDASNKMLLTTARSQSDSRYVKSSILRGAVNPFLLMMLKSWVRCHQFVWLILYTKQSKSTHLCHLYSSKSIHGLAHRTISYLYLPLGTCMHTNTNFKHPDRFFRVQPRSHSSLHVQHRA